MKHKRKRSRRQDRCTMCTKFTWMGNNKGRFKAKDEEARKRRLEEE